MKFSTNQREMHPCIRDERSGHTTRRSDPVNIEQRTRPVVGMKPKIKRFEDWLVKQINADPMLEPYREKGK